MNVLVSGVAVSGVLLLVWSIRKAMIAPQRRKWLNHKITDYDVTLRQGGSLDFVGTELGDGVTLIVRNGVLVDVKAPFEINSLAEYDPYTLDKLFQHVMFEARFDPVYGFPTRIVGWRGWAIEVINFQVRKAKQADKVDTEVKDKSKWSSNNNPSV